jgi:hypothetical protein
MKDSELKAGDIVKLKHRFDIDGPVGLIIEVYKSEMTGNGGWTTFDYIVLTSSGNILHVSDSAIDRILPE